MYVQPPPVDVVVSGPEVEVFDVELVKDNVGLGITIAGYISDKPNGKLLQPYSSVHTGIYWHSVYIVLFTAIPNMLYLSTCWLDFWHVLHSQLRLRLTQDICMAPFDLYTRVLTRDYKEKNRKNSKNYEKSDDLSLSAYIYLA